MPSSQEIQLKVFQLITQSQQNTVQAVRTVTTVVTNRAPAVAKTALADQVPQRANKAVDTAFAIAQGLLALNQNFARQLIDAATPKPPPSASADEPSAS